MNEKIHVEGNLFFDKLKLSDKKLFTTIYQENHAAVYQFLLKFLKSSELADDICQTVFLKIWENREKLIEINNIKAYLLTIAKRQALDFIKRAAIEQSALGVILQAYPQVQNSIEDSQRFEEYMTFIENALAALPAQTRQVFTLCRKHQKSYDEVAQELGISRNTVKKHMVRSLKVLRDVAQNELGIPLSVLLMVLNLKP